MADIRDFNRRAYAADTDPSRYAMERDLEMEQLAQFLDGGYGVPAYTTMDRWAGGGNIAAPTSGVVFGSYVWLPKGKVISRIAVYTRTTAGATLTHRWAALWTTAETALARQSTDNTGATMAANTLFEFTLSSTYTVPSTGFYPVGICIVGTTIPSLAGMTLGLANLASPGLTGVTTPVCAWTSGSALTATAPASVATKANTANFYQFWVY